MAQTNFRDFSHEKHGGSFKCLLCIINVDQRVYIHVGTSNKSVHEMDIEIHGGFMGFPEVGIPKIAGNSRALGQWLL